MRLRGRAGAELPERHWSKPPAQMRTIAMSGHRLETSNALVLDVELLEPCLQVLAGFMLLEAYLRDLMQRSAHL